MRRRADALGKFEAFQLNSRVFMALVLVVWLSLMSVVISNWIVAPPLQLPTVPDVLGEVDAKPAPVSAQQDELASRRVSIVMSTGNGLWNTGVWSGYGPGKKTRLAWANEGVVVDKSACTVKCDVTHDQSKIPQADAVVMEVVNHQKFLGGRARTTPFPFPERRSTSPAVPLFVSFFFEPTESHPETDDAELMGNFDVTMGPFSTSAIPLTMVCPWGRPRDDYLKMPDFAHKTKLIAYFNEHGIARRHAGYVRKLVEALGDDLDAFGTHKNRDMPPNARLVPTRIDFIAQYHFVLVTEWSVEDDWVEGEWSHAILGGAVPVYVGAPNIDDYAPSPSSYINIRDWLSQPATALANHLRDLTTTEAAYRRFFEWKKAGKLAPNFEDKLDKCVFHAECRLCEQVSKHVKRIEEPGV